MQTVKGQNGITRVYGNVEVGTLVTAELKKGVMKAQLRQIVTTTYPASKVGNELFESSDFTAVGEGKSYDSIRTTLIDVPVGITKEQVENRVTPLKDKAVLWKRISNNVMDVLTEGQKQAIEAGLQTKASFEAKLLIRTPNGDQPERNGVVITEFQQHFFSATMHEDEDFRTDINASSAAASFDLVGEQPATKAGKLTNLSQLVNA